MHGFCGRRRTNVGAGLLAIAVGQLMEMLKLSWFENVFVLSFSSDETLPWNTNR